MFERGSCYGRERQHWRSQVECGRETRVCTRSYCDFYSDGLDMVAVRKPQRQIHKVWTSGQLVLVAPETVEKKSMSSRDLQLQHIVGIAAIRP